MWRSAVLAEIPSAAAISLVCRPRASMPTTLASRSVSPAGLSSRGTCCPAASKTAVTASASSRPALASSRELVRRLLGRHWLAIGPRRRHRAIGVGGGQHAGRQRELRTRDSAVVAGAVEALVVGSGNGCERRQELRAREDSLGVIGMEPHLLPLIRVQRSGLLPDPRGDRDPSEVVDERRVSKRSDAGFVHPAALRRRCGELRHGRRVTRQIRRDQIGEVAHRRERAIERLALEKQRRTWLAGERLLPDRGVLVPGEDLPGMVGEAGGDLRVEGVPGTIAGQPHDAFLASEQALEGGIHREMDDPHRQRDLVAFRAAQRAVAVPALEPVGEKALHRP